MEKLRTVRFAHVLACIGGEKEPVKDRIAAFIREKAYKPLAAAELMEALRVAEAKVGQFLSALDQMETEGTIVKTRLGCYGAPERMSLAVGKLQGHSKGFAFLQPEIQPPGIQGDIFIGPENLAGAMHGDRAIVRLSPLARSGARVEGEVIRILTRGSDRLVGTYEGTRTSGYVVPDDTRLPHDIVIPRGQVGGARQGEKVVARITRYPDARRPAEGQILERLGAVGEAGVDILSIIRKHNLPEAFPQKTMREAEALPSEIPTEEYEQRTDLRGRLIITIDGADAKDLDDAVDVEKLSNGNWRLSVHIADVAYYVRADSALDREAFRRGASVYLADRVVPMLPAKLSDGVCSLNPREDKLTLTAEMEISPEGKKVAHKLYPSVIRTAHRMTYPEVWGILQGDAELRQKYGDVVPMLQEMHALMQALRSMRTSRGSLDFDLPEAKLVLNEQGYPVDVRRAERTDAERIIEEFMLAANETVGRHLTDLKVPLVYRIHEKPAQERLQALAEFLALFGCNLKVGKELSPLDLQKVTMWAAGRHQESLINTVVLRSMKQARYHHVNSGHFGLAAEHYCHFTSPIRRYPDLIVHRILREVWATKGTIPARQKHRLEQLIQKVAEQSSERERYIMEAERETYDLKKAEYMQGKIGEVFSGIISGVQPFGFFVQLPNTVEGLVPIGTLADDYYHFHDKHFALVGERTRRMFRLGDAVGVRLTNVNVAQRRLEFTLVPEATPAPVTAPTWLDETEAEPIPTSGQLPEKAAGAAGKNRRRRGKKTGKGDRVTVERMPAAATPAPAMSSSPEVQTPALPQKARRKTEASPLQAARPRQDAKGAALDMWGIPIPGGRRRSTEDDEDMPGLIFSITPGQDRRRRNPPASGSAPAVQPTPAPATADEQARAPVAAADGAVADKKRRRPRRPRSQKKSPAPEQ